MEGASVLQNAFPEAFDTASDWMYRTALHQPPVCRRPDKEVRKTAVLQVVAIPKYVEREIAGLSESHRRFHRLQTVAEAGYWNNVDSSHGCGADGSFAGVWDARL